MDISVAVRRLRQYIQDKPRGYSRSGAGFVTDITGLTNPSLLVSINQLAFQNITLVSTGLNTGALIAKALQTAIRAAVPLDTSFSFATVTFDAAAGYTIAAGIFGTDSAVFVSDGSPNLAAALKLGQSQGGTETYNTSPRYSDDDLQLLIGSALDQFNGSVEPYQKVQLATISDSGLTPVLYLAWIMVLEADIGSAVYSVNQVIGADSQSFTSIFDQILKLLAYLRDSYDQMKENLGISIITVSDLTRYDRTLDALMPVYAQSRMPRPTFVQLARLSTSAALVEWSEVHLADFQYCNVYTATSSGIVDRSLFNSQSNPSINGIVPTATKQCTVYNPHNTVFNVTGLSGVVYFLIMFTDSRGMVYYSDEYSLDLNNSTAQPILVIDNSPKG